MALPVYVWVGLDYYLRQKKEQFICSYFLFFFLSFLPRMADEPKEASDSQI
jgi:hypothetical protein